MVGELDGVKVGELDGVKVEGLDGEKVGGSEGRSYLRVTQQIAFHFHGTICIIHTATSSCSEDTSVSL